MKDVRFVAADLRYGCLAQEFELGESDRPLVIYGPNGSGKSSLLEGLVRTLFGFNRQQAKDRDIHETRNPWHDDEFRGRVRLRGLDGNERWLERDFNSASVEILDTAGEGIWRGDGNPGANNQEASDYRRQLREMFGLAEIAEYERTACVHQGELARTRLGDELLQAVAGGRVDIDDAKTAINDRYRRLTLEPIAEGGGSGRKKRELESVRSKIEDLGERLERVRRAEHGRRPLVEEESRLLERLEGLSEFFGRLEEAYEKLSALERRKSERARLDERIGSVDKLKRGLEEATAALKSAEESWRPFEMDPGYPDDFPERAAVVQQLLGQRRELVEKRDRLQTQLKRQPESSPWPSIVAAGVAVGGIAVGLAGHPIPGAAAALIGIAGTVLAVIRYQQRRSRIDALRNDVDETESAVATRSGDIENRLEGVPGVENAEAIDFAAPLRQFKELGIRRENPQRAQEALDNAIADASSELRSGEPHLPERADELKAHLRKTIGELRNRRAEQALAIEQSSALELPPGVPHEASGVRDALREARSHEKTVRAELDEIRAELQERGRPETSAAVLEDELAALQEHEAEIERTTAVLRAAYQLIGDAYEQFRESDQERLVDLVSCHLDIVSDGVLGPLTDAHELKDVKVYAYDREVPLKYRPLSYGQWHSALLAIRLGAADFLAHAGIRVPLIIDEPFANLDDHYDEAVWKSFQQVAHQRQVIVTTQERAMLERLGIEADIVLERVARRREGNRRASGPTRA